MKHHDKTPHVDPNQNGTDDRDRSRESHLNLKPSSTPHQKNDKLKQSTKPPQHHVIENINKRQLANMLLDIQAAVAFFSRIIFKQQPGKTHHPMAPRHVSSASGPLASIKTKAQQMQKDIQHTPIPTPRVEQTSPAKRNADQFNRIQPGVPILAPFMQLLSRYRDGMQARLIRAKQQAIELANQKQAETQLHEPPMSTHLPDSPTPLPKLRATPTPKPK